jgi:hypothetical protein
MGSELSEKSLVGEGTSSVDAARKQHRSKVDPSAGGFGEAAGDECGPTGLMVCAESASNVCVEVFVEEDAISPVRIGGVSHVVTEAGAETLFVEREDGGQPA